MRIMIPQTNGNEGRDSSVESEEDEDDGVRGMWTEGDMEERESEVGESIALKSVSIVNISQVNSSCPNLGSNNDKEEGVEISKSVEGVRSKEDSRLVDGARGPQNSTTNHHNIKVGVHRRLAQSDNMGCVTKPNRPKDTVNGGEVERGGGVYSDGPRNVYLKLNKSSVHIDTTLLSKGMQVKNSKVVKHVNPIPAAVRKKQQIINNLNLKVPNPDISLQATISTSSRTGDLSRNSEKLDEGVVRSSPSRFRRGKNPDNSCSSVGTVLCCSSLNSSDIRNCNKRSVEVYELDKASKVWQEAAELGVEGDEEEEQYVERIMFNERREWCLGGDFNSISKVGERRGSSSGAWRQGERNEFIQFIDALEVVYIPLKGKMFSWFNSDGSAMSRLDRFLVSEGFIEKDNLSYQWVGDRDISEHFRKKTWENIDIQDKKAFIIKETLKGLKEALKVWNREVFGFMELKIDKTMKELNEVEELLATGNIDANLINPKELVMQFWEQLNFKESLLHQKSRTKWAQEGDSNSRYFHASIKSRRRKNQIVTLKKDGEWIQGVAEIKEEVRDHYSKQFFEEWSNRPFLQGINFNTLSADDNASLLQPFVEEEVATSRPARPGKHKSEGSQKLANVGEHLSPGLTGLMRKVVELEKFKGYHLNNNIQFQILQFADDTILMGEGIWDNIWIIKTLLRIFELVSGLKINFVKSKLYGLNVDSRLLEVGSAFLSCRSEVLPFKFLGIPVGVKPRRQETWKPVVDAMIKRLNSWSESSNSRKNPPPRPNIPKSFLYTETEIHEDIAACTQSIIGKIITDKPIHVSSIQNGLESIWGSPEGLKIQELGGRILQFFMTNEADKDRILQGNPWIFRNSWLIVKPWDRETDINSLDFDHVPIWIQLWGLPPHCKTKKMGESIGALMGNVEASEFYEYPGKNVIIKIKVGINIHNLITSGIHVGNPIDGINWIDYRYEKLPQVCFKCGMIGHIDKLCRNQALDLDTLAPLGPWLRSTQYGKIKMEAKHKKYYSNPSHSKNFGQYSPPVPTDLLEKLAAMKVNSSQEQSTKHTPTPQADPKPLSQDIPAMNTTNGLQITSEDRGKKAHRLNYNTEAMSTENTQEIAAQHQTFQAKRQKMEEISRGLGNPKTVRALKKLFATHHPDIIFLMETKLMDSQYQFLDSYRDSYTSHFINCSVTGGGRAGGLALIWNHCTVNMDIKNFDLNYIDMLISSSHTNFSWRATGIYGYPQAPNKYLTCRLINDLACTNNNSNWLVFGDFNLVLTNMEKSGGNPIEPNITTSFRNTLCHCDLQDLGYKGSTYTWTNRHQGDLLIQSRLDRFLATADWISNFPNFVNNHLTRYKSDHCPILLDFSNITGISTNNNQYYPKKFEQIWTTDDHHTYIVTEAWQNQQGSIDEKLRHTLNALHNWGRKTFGIIPKRIKETHQDLYNLQQLQTNNHITLQIKNKEKELDHLLEKEEMWWSQRSRALWLTHGDKNTKFFHQNASQRRRKNKIECIKDPMHQTHTNKEEIERIFVTHFQELFTSQTISNAAETAQVVHNKLDQEMHDYLAMNFTAEEVYLAIKDMKSLAGPGPDGLPTRFYHTYWDIVGNDITKEVLQVLNHGGNPKPFNSTHICLIPKTNNPSYPSDFRPISLCNVTLKIITKTIANRLKTILPNIISPNQSAFVPRRLISDNTIIANEIFHYLNLTTRKTGYVGIKTDMAKAYDRLEWEFLQITMEAMNFPTQLVNTIMNCVSTVSFSILVNGKPTKPFLPKRGLRQGDPLSPYLFILCADVFSALITKSQQNKLIQGVKIAPGAPEITHLFFADDSLMFCRANEEETTQMQAIITEYQLASGQLVNYNKSEMVFSKRVPNTTKSAIQQILPMKIVDHYSKYLGQPTHVGRSKKQIFNLIQDKIWKKLKGWKEKNLSFAGRGTLIKAVAQAIPTYLMSNFLIPKGVCHQMESMISKLWWASNVDKRKIHWVNWKTICKQKKLGGMGFRDLRAFNEALLAKQGWKILTEQNSLMAKTMKAKYFPQTQFLQAKKGARSSYIWQDIQQASWILKKGCCWLVGNGQNINIWNDRWINTQDSNTTWSPKPLNTTLEQVSDLIDQTSHQWNAQIITQNFLPIEANQILQIPLANTNEEDIVCWQGTNDGNYTVGSGYNAQMTWDTTGSEQAQPSNTLEGEQIWNKLWQIKAPPKQLHLLWRILNNAIPVKTNLIAKGILCDSICPTCNQSLETTDHTFLQCEWARLVWFGSPLTITTTNAKNQNFSDWLRYMLTNSSSTSMQLISTITYSIWLARNKKVFQNQYTPADEVVARALNSLTEYQKHLVEYRLHSKQATSSDRNNICWSPPPLNCLKLNVDAHLNDDGRWGFFLSCGGRMAAALGRRLECVLGHTTWLWRKLQDSNKLSSSSRQITLATPS
ncbi:hypothetical protein TSUD_413680 [Trifolium subterraneum]|uniref:Reverse transcriptase domain-containing protein n=1 Tax=Trifolium subterraneum TaxID=3900 RepID=A0A2Z6PUI4_TRISU|nr:hypothetical protein TSUD_413680 [Trifolium subterraneum]